ncbi:acetoacetate--CoA ligase [Sphingobacterium deserti]|uniref:Acetoacetyl-CoA synthase n=1 Tax=Sphingobacterium deserti TaxID=1229276 RepID=A0A0B8T1I3_9SPHI|nr:acetoacetate--CoA ligase [Sphingobacterium deserti]KGE14546.1 acetoacetyl-CoA synthase [Sphingobacterium deserti]
MKNPLWVPTESYKKDAVLANYQMYLEDTLGYYFDSYKDLYIWSVENIEEFWESILRYFSIQYTGTYRNILSRDESAVDFIHAKWFEGISLSYAEHIFAGKKADEIAIYYKDETNNYSVVTWSELEKMVSVIQQFLRSRGVQAGDRVVAVLNNTTEAVALFLAVNSLGAIWSCCSPDFGDKSIVERFALIEPKLLFVELTYQYNGKTFKKTDTLEAIREQVPSLEACINIDGDDWKKIFNDFYALPLVFERVPFYHPIWILYSSGTTGKPKAIVHGTGGNLLEHLKALALHQNVQTGEKFLWYTTTGWMMWNYALSSLLCGASLCLYNGAVQYNNHQDFWDYVRKIGVDHLGAGAAYYSSIHELEIKGYQPKVIGSTGSPLPVATFENLQEKFPNAQIISLSGGTDVCSAFLSGCPLLPVYAGTIQCRTLGAAIVAINDKGEEVYNEVGELLINEPMPSMPVYFWNDPGHTKYKESYFSQHPGKWSHGDWISIADNGSVTMHGRSDATLNRGGVRIGTAEIYNAVQTVDSIADSLVISTEDQHNKSQMILFLKLQFGIRLDDVVPVLKSTLRQQYSARHIPDLFLSVPDIPYTLSGKKLEIPVKKIFSGKSSKDAVSKDIMRNPDSLEAYEKLYMTLIT